eukprot:7481738-Pyramimonas_sp.AAC.1
MPYPVFLLSLDSLLPDSRQQSKLCGSASHLFSCLFVGAAVSVDCQARLSLQSVLAASLPACLAAAARERRPPI